MSMDRGGGAAALCSKTGRTVAAPVEARSEWQGGAQSFGACGKCNGAPACAAALDSPMRAGAASAAWQNSSVTSATSIAAVRANAVVAMLDITDGLRRDGLIGINPMPLPRARQYVWLVPSRL
jgi:hypothetical protein